MALKNPLVKWTLVRSHDIKSSVDRFWRAMDIYTTRSHIINRRQIGGEIIGKVIIECDDQLVDLKNIISQPYNGELLQKIVEKENNSSEEINKEQCVVAIIKRTLPKQKNLPQTIEIILKDYAKTHASFLNGPSSANTSSPSFSYAYSYNNGKLDLWVEEWVEESDKSYQWIVSKVTPKLIKWMESEKTSSGDVSSLQLVPVTRYSLLYNELKERYGKPLIQMWPEQTDPLKFVYEDIGIATYLLLLWEGQPKQRFIDLGCGNGLLVHILNSEGHLGIGYDLRARKIWSMYPPSTKLQVHTIIPSSETLFPETDWLIGNHSDELTVWIPVMAARSSFTCNFFLLPCCPYEFNGRKYCRENTSVSQYSDFLSYVERVCAVCGIVAEKDKLRIPSTKRTCFVGRTRTYLEDEWHNSLTKLQEFIDSKCSLEAGDDKAWCPQFKPRGEERVKNCTQVESNIRESIVNLVAEQLLAKRRSLENKWSYGGVVEISTLAKIIPGDTLKKLKNECGGLQTLLKNHHYIFKVQGGKVEFRVPVEKVKSECSAWKTKPCWFYHNHPNSCPLEDEKCSFFHAR